MLAVTIADGVSGGSVHLHLARTGLNPFWGWHDVTSGVHPPPKIVLDEVVEQALAVIYVKDLTGRYLYVNRQYEVVAGISSEATLGRTDADLFPPAIAAVYRANDLQTLQGVSPLRFDEPDPVEGGERLIATVKFPVLEHEEVVGVGGISVHLTQQPQDQAAATADRQIGADVSFGRLLATLTPQEVRVLDLLATGLSDREIAEKLSLSRDTVRHHVSHLLRKLRRRRPKVIIEMLKRRRS